MAKETNYDHDQEYYSMNSIEETNNYLQQQGDDELIEEEVNMDYNSGGGGVGRLYECVFCKRGFNTAQALGGHMNIHRKDRSAIRNKTPSTSSTHHDHVKMMRMINSNYKKQHEIHTGSSSNIYNHEPMNHHDHHDNNSDCHDRREAALNPLVVPCDRRMSLSLGFSPRDLNMNRRAMNQKEDLDLELRLGYM